MGVIGVMKRFVHLLAEGGETIFPTFFPSEVGVVGVEFELYFVLQAIKYCVKHIGIFGEETGIYAAQSGEGTDESAAETEEDIQVHITQSGSRYHREGCSSLENSDTVISLDEAKSRGYTPCQRCHPPE